MNYEQRLDDLITIQNKRSILSNFKYAIKKDENIFKLNKLILSLKNADDIDSMERMDKYYFEKNLIGYQEILEKLFLLSKNQINDNAFDLLKSCKVLPDYEGRTLLTILSYLPIVRLINQYLKYVEINEKVNNHHKNKNEIKASWLKEDSNMFRQDGLLKTRVPNYIFEDEQLEIIFLQEKIDSINIEELKNDISSLLEHMNENISVIEIIGLELWESSIITDEIITVITSEIINKSNLLLNENIDKIDFNFSKLIDDELKMFLYKEGFFTPGKHIQYDCSSKILTIKLSGDATEKLDVFKNYSVIYKEWNIKEFLNYDKDNFILKYNVIKEKGKI